MLGGEDGSAVGVILLVAGLGLVPFMVVTTTAFMKIAVVLFLIRNALGIQQTPPNLVLYGIAIVLAVFLTSPVVGSVFAEVSDQTLDYANFEDWERAAERVKIPIQQHLLKFTDEPARNFFYQATAEVWPEEAHEAASSDDLMILIPAFMISELTRAFEIGFLLYLPFIVIDLIISNILLAMGMMMVSPLVISVPFKLFLFVLVDGWSRLLEGLVLSYQ
ncbi:MAG: type III secretion system export apparatus subunit SctR [Geminicoccaceae bacterium]